MGPSGQKVRVVPSQQRALSVVSKWGAAHQAAEGQVCGISFPSDLCFFPPWSQRLRNLEILVTLKGKLVSVGQGLLGGHSLSLSGLGGSGEARSLASAQRQTHSQTPRRCHRKGSCGQTPLRNTDTEVLSRIRANQASPHTERLTCREQVGFIPVGKVGSASGNQCPPSHQHGKVENQCPNPNRGGSLWPSPHSLRTRPP